MKIIIKMTIVILILTMILTILIIVIIITKMKITILTQLYIIKNSLIAILGIKEKTITK